MNRRQFLQYTVALAVAAPLAKLTLLPANEAVATMLQQPYPPEWIPTETEVHEWLQYYKITVQHGAMRFHDLVQRSFTSEPSLANTREELGLFEEAERAYDKTEYDRGRVGYAAGQGYGLGRTSANGIRPGNAAFTGPSNEGFAWHNGWIVGHNDLHNRVTPA